MMATDIARLFDAFGCWGLVALLITGAVTPFGTIPLDEEVQIKKRTEDMGKRRQLEEQFYKVKQNRSLSEQERERRLERLREQARELRQ